MVQVHSVAEAVFPLFAVFAFAFFGPFSVAHNFVSVVPDFCKTVCNMMFFVVNVSLNKIWTSDAQTGTY